VEITIKLPTLWRVAECPRRDSNPHLRFRKPPFYPLNYGDEVKGKSKNEEGRSPESREQKTEGKIQKSDFGLRIGGPI
jgi:hypothetical protein